MTTRQEISDWLDRAKGQGASHVLIVRDILDEATRPVFVAKTEDFWVQYRLYDDPKKTSRVREVYDVSLPKEDQLNEFTAWHTPPQETLP